MSGQLPQKTGLATKNLEKLFPRHRMMDYVICGYFVFQIPSTLLFDTQAVYIESLYPSMLKSIRRYYLETYKDPFFADAWKHPWYLSLCLVEHVIGVPFYFWAAWNFCIHGALKKPFVIIPSMLYATHTFTAILAIWFMAIGADFSQYQALAPSTNFERVSLCFAYSPFFIMASVIMYHTWRLTLSKKWWLNYQVF